MLQLHCSIAKTSAAAVAAAGLLLQKYASVHTAKDTGTAAPYLQVDDLSSPVHAKQPAEAETRLPAPQKTASNCQKSRSSISDRSLSSGCRAPGPKQRRRRHETPAFLADPLGAFACQATQRQRTLQSGLSMLKGKTSQTRLVAPNLRPPNEELAAQLDTCRFQPTNTAAQPPAQPTKGHKHRKGQQSQGQNLQQQSPDWRETGPNCHQQKAQNNAKTRRPPLAEVRPPGTSQSGLSHSHAQDTPAAPRQANTSYFHDLKQSIYTLVQANHAIPSLHTMSDTDKAALTSLLANKLDGVNIQSDLQALFSSSTRANAPSTEPQLSAGSFVDCTSSPVSVAQHDARPCKLPKLTPPGQHVHFGPRPSAMLSVHASHTSHASAASSGSGHRHIPMDSGCFPSRQTAADSAEELFDLHTKPMNTHYSMRQDQDQSYSRDSDAMFLDSDVAACHGSPRIDWYASLCNQAMLCVAVSAGAWAHTCCLAAERGHASCKVV